MPAGLFLQQPGRAQAHEFVNRVGPETASVLDAPKSGVLVTLESPQKLIAPISLFLESLGYVAPIAAPSKAPCSTAHPQLALQDISNV